MEKQFDFLLSEKNEELIKNAEKLKKEVKKHLITSVDKKLDLKNIVKSCCPLIS